MIVQNLWLWLTDDRLRFERGLCFLYPGKHMTILTYVETMRNDVGAASFLIASSCSCGISRLCSEANEKRILGRTSVVRRESRLSVSRRWQAQNPMDSAIHSVLINIGLELLHIAMTARRLSITFMRGSGVDGTDAFRFSCHPKSDFRRSATNDQLPRVRR